MIEAAHKNFVKAFSPGHLAGVEALSLHFNAARKAPRHVHYEYVFSLALEGASRFDCGHCGETHIVEPGDLLLTEAHEVYAAETIGNPPWRNVSLSVTKEKLLSVLESAADGRAVNLPHYAQGKVRNQDLRTRFTALMDSLSISDVSPLERETRLFEWLVSLQEIYAAPPERIRRRRVYNETEAVRRARDFIQANLAENIDLATLAGVARLSPFYFNRAFSRQVGLPPHEYQNQIRIRKSTELIRQRKSFAEIALELGFSDQSHFNRFFKRYFGITPRVFSAS